jgi:soluble cytochrome b562
MRKTSGHGTLTVALVASVVLAAGTAGAASTALKDVMKKMGAASAGEDAKALAPLLTQTITLKPNDPDFAGWDAVADKGKAAADRGDLAAAKASCKECHTQFRDKYKTKYGSKAP